jgi:hypothetical protein
VHILHDNKPSFFFHFINAAIAFRAISRLPFIYGHHIAGYKNCTAANGSSPVIATKENLG